MRHERVVVLGGSGFIGRHLAAHLTAEVRSVVVPTRRVARARELLALATVDVVDADVHDDRDLDRVLDGADAVVNLVGVLHGGRGRPYGRGFAQAHVELPRRLGPACARAGIRRLVHVSALGVRPDARGPSMYLRSKTDGEHAVRQSGLDWTILRPSVVFGPDDAFLNLFARLLRIFPVMALAGARCHFQPVHVGDVAAAIAHALDEPACFGATYELAGPETFTLAQLVTWVGSVTGHPRPVLALPDALGRLQAWFLEHAPGPTLMSVDNVDSMKIDNVATGKVPCFPPVLRVTPVPLTATAPAWLAPSHAADHGEAHLLALRDRSRR